MQRVKQEEQLPSPNGSSPLASPLPSSTGAYTDYVLYSAPPSAAEGWRYNIMKFGALGDRTVDPSSAQFIQPVKLNRKDPRTVRRLTDEDRDRINKRILERNGMDVDAIKGEDGIKDEAGFVKKEKEQIDLALVGTGKNGVAPNIRSKNNLFKKKTKRVFVSSEEARRLKREEWMPWVLEDDEGNERWIGRLEGGTGERPTSATPSAAQLKQAKADANGTGMKGWRPPPPPSEAGGGGSSYVAFVNDPEKDGFQVVPVHRWYKFSQGPKYVTLGTEEAENEYERQQKSNEDQRWVMHRRNNPSNATPKDPSSIAAASSSSSSKPFASSSKSSKSAAAAAAASDSNSGIRSRLLDKSVASGRRLSGQQPAGGRKFQAVNRGSQSRDEDDELGARVKSEGQEQGDDEFDYDEEFQDDEEGIAKIDDLADEQETKELEERIKKEMRAANRYEGVPEDDDDDEEWEQLTNTGKDVKKLVRKNDRTGAYDSDDDASSDDNASVASNEPAKDAAASRSSSSRPSGSSHHRSHSTSSTSNRQRDSRHPSRAGSPSGSALVAKRATSPTGSASGKKSRGSSPAPSSGGGKRKRPDGTDGGESDGGKRRKNASPAPGEVAGLITEGDLVALFKTKEGYSITTQEVLSHFKSQLRREPQNRALISSLLRNVANLVDGKLVLKSGL